jgi:hypothetical protein
MCCNCYFFPKQITATEGASLSGGVPVSRLLCGLSPPFQRIEKVARFERKSSEGERWRGRRISVFLKNFTEFWRKVREFVLIGRVGGMTVGR